jgi:hypothetical protein
MDKDRLKKKLIRETTELRRTAKAVQEAIDRAEMKERAEKSRPKYSSVKYDDTIKNGKPLHKAALLIKDWDSSKVYGRSVHILTQEQIDELEENIMNSPECKAVLGQAYEIYNGAVEYTRLIVGLRAQWQKVVAEMSRLLTRWSDLDNIAESMNSLYSNLVDKMGEAEAKSLMERVSFIYPDNTSVIFNQETQLYEADVDTGGLYQAILKKQKEAEYHLQVLRSAVEPFSDFLYHDVTFADGEVTLPLWFVPEVTDRIMEYPDAVEFGLDEANYKYFAYSILQRESKGETITPMDKKRAVIPDYNQVTEIPRHLNSNKARISKLFKNFIDTDGNNE